MKQKGDIRQVTMVDRSAAERICKDPNPIIDGRKANVNLAYLGAKPRIQATELLAALPIGLKTGFGLQNFGGQIIGIPQQIYPTAAYFTPSAGVGTTVAYQLPAGAAAPAATGPYSPRAVATSPAAAASPFFDLAVHGYPAPTAGLTTIPGVSVGAGGYDTAAYPSGTFGAIPASAPAAGGYLIAAGGHDGLTAQFATGHPPSAMTQYAVHYQ